MMAKCLVLGAVLLFTVTAAAADSPVEPYSIEIERVQSVLQGTRCTVDVTVTEGSSPIHGFDMLINHDPVALSLQQILPGPVVDECGWEYFTFRYGFNGMCGSDPCPPGVVRVVAVAEINNGSVHPSCFTTDLPFVLFSIEYLVTDDRTYECTFVPIRFRWFDCGDNSMAVSSDDDLVTIDLALSRDVFDFDGTSITDGDAEFPTYAGAPDECFGDVPGVPIRAIDFYNGGLDIICADTIDILIGDINLNRITYEIADMVMFHNYFLFGPGALTDPEGSAWASDINADGVTLTIEDYVSGVRIVMGDYVPPPGVPDTITVYDNSGAIRFEGHDLGAMLLTFTGDVSPTLLAPDMTIGWAYDSQTNSTHVLIDSFGSDVLRAGDVLWYTGGNLFALSAATYYGNKVFIKLGQPTGVDDPDLLPSRFALHQNYPNPFNPKTVIPFDLPGQTSVEFEVFNVLGERVYNSTGTFTAGSHEINWRGIDNNNQPLAGGIYFYRLTAGEITGTRKMILLK